MVRRQIYTNEGIEIFDCLHQLSIVIHSFFTGSKINSMHSFIIQLEIGYFSDLGSQFNELIKGLIFFATKAFCCSIKAKMMMMIFIFKICFSPIYLVILHFYGKKHYITQK